jgi:peptidylamidoglycolate lyase
MNNYREIGYLCVLNMLLLTGCGNTEKKETIKESSNQDSYELVEDWPKLPEDFGLGNPTGLGIYSNHNILVFHRASRVWQEPMPETRIQEHTILTLDQQTGEILKS